MKINLTFDFSEEDRRAISSHYGEKKPASRSDVETMIRSAVDASLTDFRDDFRRVAEEGPKWQ